MKSTIKFAYNIALVAILCVLLFVTSFIIYYWYTGIDRGYPGGEISFIGLNKEDVAKKIDHMRTSYKGDSKIVIALNGDNYKYFDKSDDILKNEFVSKSNLWGVNYKSNKRVFYLQMLIFGEDGKVKSQYIKRSWDGF